MCVCACVCVCVCDHTSLQVPVLPYTWFREKWLCIIPIAGFLSIITYQHFPLPLKVMVITNDARKSNLGDRLPETTTLPVNKTCILPIFPSLIFKGYDMLVSGRLVSKFVKIHHQDYSCLPSGKLTWQWKILVLCRKDIFQWSISYCYVRLPECRSGIRILVDPSFSNPGAEKFRHPQIAKVHGIRSIESWKCSLIGVIHLNILRSSWLGRFHLTSKRCLWTLIGRWSINHWLPSIGNPNLGSFHIGRIHGSEGHLRHVASGWSPGKGRVGWGLRGEGLPTYPSREIPPQKIPKMFF